MVREDLIEGAIAFLQDPSVSAAPLERRLAFLRSKNLTQDEIDASLARVGQPQATSTSYPPSPQQYQQRPPSTQQYAYQQPYPPTWAQPPPELPRRDWRDWFVMATVLGGAGYGLYWTAKRYIAPLIFPPTPPQLEQDKAHIDASFDKAFALLDKLATDTAELKAAEQARTERLDAALSEVEGVVRRLKPAQEEREAQARRVGRGMEELRELIPRAAGKEREVTDARLRDLAREMKSLKTLVANRLQSPQQQQRATPSFAPSQASGSPPVNGASTPTGPSPAPPTGNTAGIDTVNNMSPSSSEVTDAAKPPSPSSSIPASRSNSAAPYNRLLGGGKAQIPSWQLAAKKRSEEATAKKFADAAASTGTSTPQDVSESGTVDNEGGA